MIFSTICLSYAYFKGFHDSFLKLSHTQKARLSQEHGYDALPIAFTEPSAVLRKWGIFHMIYWERRAPQLVNAILYFGKGFAS